MSEAHTFHPTVLREYDIRGIVGSTLTAADARAVGRAFGTVVARGGGKTVCVGYDGRLSSPELEAAMVDGLVACGLHVLRIGLGPTPMLYFATRDREAAAGIMITGSHNPPDYNGIKMMLGKGPVYGRQILDIGAIASKADYVSGEGSSEQLDIKDAYVERLLRDYDGTRDLTIAWDAGNGASGEILRRLTAKLPGKHVLLFDEIDGNFPNHHPDPTVEKNLVDLKAAVAEHGCDIGIGFDGDGDRIGAIDHLGRVVWGDQLVAIYAADVLKSHPGATIIADVKASQTLFDEIARLGGNPLMWKTGHSLLKAKMAETGSPLAGEMSGHIFFADKWYGFDDALYCAVRLIGLVSKLNQPLSELRDRLPDVVNTPETRFQVSEERKFQVVQEVKARLKAEGADVNDIDGVRVKTADGWWLLRASNTQDVLVARAESGTPEGLERLKGMVVAQLEASGLQAPSFEDGGSAH
ncbi:phosphomannomutase/phosphoglucomutase (plasmid) [Azospirillum brasilense]|uniref:Phosphomannomutase n=1 Tax=Azospirillum brasilense TaxID=192 RepID=Q6QW67_AZOBR|nr:MULTISPECIES: phosphomannomutase/phosphoglucomutase [Azospirillum]AAS82999.1 phosphomannomutase [Azospirillum brasilense]ALJ39568.1 phosphomannomutase [Azospirillum brasilense]MDW7555793.1 phosphomannomutase/phosphoglucomutase [Azospirillum brasilense]MDW7595771.1 phosphomannomutase/phosphoglucomutase [Azospirillum brasilense]MDW7630776.1 phosphomannomutase/phosphoglucomutase [Azospirillum brasilense]